jgi:hypothetical protein
VSEEKPEEGTKRRYHQLSHSGTAGPGVTEQKTRDVVGSQFAEAYRFFPKTFNEEMSEETPISADRYGRKAPFLPEISFILLLEHSQWGSIYRQVCRWNDALVTQVFKEVMHSSWITVSEPSRTTPFLQEAFDYLLLQIDEYQPLPFEPLFQVVQKPQPFSHGRSGITELGHAGDERIQMRSKQACPPALNRRRVRKKSLKHLSPPMCGLALDRRRTKLCRVCNRGDSKSCQAMLEKQKPSRHKSGIGIMPIMPNAA